MSLLAGGAGWNIDFLATVLLMSVVIVVICGIALFWSTRHPIKEPSLEKYIAYWALIIGIIFVLFVISTSAYLPYPYAHSNVKPGMIVDVRAQQFSWCLSPSPSFSQCTPNYQSPVCEVVLFNVTSMDVTHGFGVYDSQGAIIFQVQVLPGYYDSIMYQFTVPGTYYIRCLEFCGFGHYDMISQFIVS